MKWNIHCDIFVGSVLSVYELAIDLLCAIQGERHYFLIAISLEMLFIYYVLWIDVVNRWNIQVKIRNTDESLIRFQECI